MSCVEGGRGITKTGAKQRRSGDAEQQGGISPTIEKGNQFLARALSAQGEGNRRQTVDSIETEQDIIVLEERAKARQQSVCS